MIPVNRASLEERRKHLYRNVKKAEDETFGAAVTSTRRESFLLVNAYLARAAAAKYAENDKITIDGAFLIAKNYYETAIRKEDISFVEDIEFGFEFDDEEEAVLKGTDEEAVKELIAKAIFIAMLTLIEEYNGAPIKTIEDFKIKNLKTPKAKRAKEYLLDELSSDEDEASGYFSNYVLNQKRKIVSDRMPRIKFDDQGKEEPKEVDRVKKDRLIAKDENFILSVLKLPIAKMYEDILRAKPNEKRVARFTTHGYKDNDGKPTEIVCVYALKDKEIEHLAECGITAEDLQIIQICDNFFLSGQTAFTVKHLIRQMKAGSDIRANPKQIEKCFKRVQALSNTIFQYTNKAEYENQQKLIAERKSLKKKEKSENQRRIKDVVEVSAKGRMLDVLEAEIKVNGKIADKGFVMLRTSLLYQHAESKGQVVEVPANCFGVLPITAKNAAIEVYMLKQVAWDKGHDFLKWETIWKGSELESDPNKAQLRAKVETLLFAYKKGGLIKSYKLTETGIELERTSKTERKALLTELRRSEEVNKL